MFPFLFKNMRKIAGIDLLRFTAQDTTVVSRIERLILRHIICHPISINSPQNRGHGEIRYQQLIYMTKRFFHICTIDRNLPSRDKLLVKYTFSYGNIKIIRICEAQSVPPRIEITSSLLNSSAIFLR